MRKPLGSTTLLSYNNWIRVNSCGVEATFTDSLPRIAMANLVICNHLTRVGNGSLLVQTRSSYFQIKLIGLKTCAANEQRVYDLFSAVIIWPCMDHMTGLHLRGV